MNLVYQIVLVREDIVDKNNYLIEVFLIIISELRNIQNQKHFQVKYILVYIFMIYYYIIHRHLSDKLIGFTSI